MKAHIAAGPPPVTVYMNPMRNASVESAAGAQRVDRARDLACVRCGRRPHSQETHLCRWDGYVGGQSLRDLCVDLQGMVGLLVGITW